MLPMQKSVIRVLTLFVFYAIAIQPAMPSSLDLPSAPAKEIETMIIDRGIFMNFTDDDGNTRLVRIQTPSITVQSREEVACMVEVKIPHKLLHLSAQLTGPAPLVNFRPQARHVSFSQDGRTVMSEIEMNEDRALIGYLYTLETGIDPPGQYTFTCLLEGVPFETRKLWFPSAPF